MNLQTMARQALANIQAAVPTGVSTVVYGSQSASGTVRNSVSAIEQTMAGDVGQDVCSVYVNAESISKPNHGDRMTVDGVVVYVMGSSLDAVGAVRRIDYSKTRAATGMELI